MTRSSVTLARPARRSGAAARRGQADWRILNDPPQQSAETQMARDVQLATEPIPTLRLFRWNPPAISLGWKQPHPEWPLPSQWRAAGLELVERPTGGGMAFHGSDVSVSVIIPRALGLSLDLLMRATTHVAATLCRSYGVEAHTSAHERRDGRVTYCLAEASSYAVWVGTRKVAGFALRRYPHTWLVQGSLLVQSLPAALVQALPLEAIESFTSHAVSLSDAVGRSLSEQDVAQRWAERWPVWWEEVISPMVQPSQQTNLCNPISKSAESFWH